MGKKNILEAKVLQSKVHGDQVKVSEKWLGYLLGPAGALLLNIMVS